LAYVGDVVGTGSSRKSATNSILWFFGEDIPNVPNKRGGGVCIGNKIAPIFYNTMEDSGALPLEMAVDKLNMGDVIDIFPYEGVVKKSGTDEELVKFSLKTKVLLDEVRAGGRIPLIIGKSLTSKARASLGLAPSTVFRLATSGDSKATTGKKTGFTLAQKMVGRACGLPEGKGTVFCNIKRACVLMVMLLMVYRCAAWRVLRALHDDGGFPGHHWPHDQRRAEGLGMLGLLRGLGDAVLLPHRRLSQAGGCRHSPHPAW
jgi:aconitate hydratase 2/2-methylisocitrate dehydratase